MGLAKRTLEASDDELMKKKGWAIQPFSRMKVSPPGVPSAVVAVLDEPTFVATAIEPQRTTEEKPLIDALHAFPPKPVILTQLSKLQEQLQTCAEQVQKYHASSASG